MKTSPIRMYFTALGIMGILAFLAMMTAADRVGASYECMNLQVAKSTAHKAYRLGDYVKWRQARVSIKNRQNLCK